jgi:hypothetical protein
MGASFDQSQTIDTRTKNERQAICSSFVRIQAEPIDVTASSGPAHATGEPGNSPRLMRVALTGDGGHCMFVECVRRAD